MTKPVPYPGDTLAKGWRFELDLEKIEQSDTWALAPAEIRPWLLMLWAKAWKQKPCGSLPDDDELICARIEIPRKLWDKHRTVLRRGWWKAEDGRLYHDAIAERVQEMLKAKEGERNRKAEYRRRMEAERQAALAAAHDALSRGTTEGQTPDGQGSPTGRDDTGTGTGTGTSLTQVVNVHEGLGAGSMGVGSASPTKTGEIAKAIRRKGIADCSPGHAEFRSMVEKGVPVETFEAAADICVKSKPPKGFAYLLTIVRNQLAAAAAVDAAPGLPEKPWDDSKSSILAMAEKLGLPPWDEAKASLGQGPRLDQYTQLVRRELASRQPQPA